jgi:hypothetical protein
MRLLLLAALTGWAFYFLLHASPAPRPPAAAPPIDQSGPLPAGKPNVHFRDARLKDAFKDWLTLRGVPHRVHFVGGKEYVVWDGPESLSYDFITGGQEAWK